MVVFVSFLGFWLENCWLAISKGFINNRNMNLPFLLGYGLAIVFFYVFLGTPNSMRITERFKISLSKRAGFILYFILAFILVSVGELILGTFVERFFGFEYWNYTCLPLNITKYTSVPTSLGFGAAITLFMKYGFDAVMSYIKDMPETVVKIAGIALMVLLVADFFVSFAIMYHNRSLYVRWVIKLRKV